MSGSDSASPIFACLQLGLPVTQDPHLFLPQISSLSPALLCMVDGGQFGLRVFPNMWQKETQFARRHSTDLSPPA